MTAIRIAITDDHQTIRFAAAELQRCLAQASGQQVEVLARDTPRQTPALWLGLTQHSPGVALPRAAARADARFDDAIGIATEAASGIICGTNPRSVLLAVYRYLHVLGCRWVQPGADGEYIPALNLAQSGVQLFEAASYRHRGICIEGAVSYEHVRDLIDWMPKVGLNAYFVQFREGFTFFDRWYSHRGHPTARPAGLARGTTCAITPRSLLRWPAHCAHERRAISPPRKRNGMRSSNASGRRKTNCMGCWMSTCVRACTTACSRRASSARYVRPRASGLYRRSRTRERYANSAHRRD